MIRVSYTYLILLFILPLINGDLFSQKENLTFEHITVDDGIPHKAINTILQDRFGFLWIGTGNGLARYDGKEIIVYSDSNADSSSIIDDSIIFIEEDNDDLWIGTYNGLSKYLRDSDRFINYVHNPSDSNSISDNTIISIYKDLAGNVWISTAEGGLNKIDKKELTKPLTSIKITRLDVEKILFGIKKIHAVCEDLEANLWISSENGLIRLNPISMESKIFQVVSSKSYSPENDFLDLEIDGNLIWLSSRYEGLYCFDIEESTFSNYLPSKFGKELHTPNRLTDIHLDGEKIWLGTFSGGILSFDKESKRFYQYNHNPNDPLSLYRHNSHVSTVKADNNGTIWIATYLGALSKVVKEKNLFRRIWFGINENTPQDRMRNVGWGRIHNDFDGRILIRYNDKISKYDVDQHAFREIKAKPFDYKVLKEKDVTDIIPDNSTTYYIGTRQGLKKYNILTGESSYFKIEEKADETYNHNWIYKIIKDSDGTIWSASHRGGELIKFNPENENFSLFQYDSVMMYNIPFLNRITALCNASDSNIWLGTNDGKVFSFNKNTSLFKEYSTENIPGYVTGIFEDSKQRIWVCKSFQKIMVFNRDKSLKKILKLPRGFTTNSNQSIFEDARGRILLNSTHSIVVYNSNLDFVDNYNLILGDDEICGMFQCKISGFLFIPTRKSLYFFHPDSLKKNPFPPQIALTGFSIFNESVQISENSPLKQNITVAEKIVLDHWQNDFSIDYAALHFSDPTKNQYNSELHKYVTR